nr:MAG TPA: hypothetical protein [Caudoviricetes sp.]
MSQGFFLIISPLSLTTTKVRNPYDIRKYFMTFLRILLKIFCIC